MSWAAPWVRPPRTRTSHAPRRRSSRRRADQYCPRCVKTAIVLFSRPLPLALPAPCGETHAVILSDASGSSEGERVKGRAERRSAGTRPPEPGDIAAPLLRWFERARRDLPWRRDPTPYRVWVSE